MTPRSEAISSMDVIKTRTTWMTCQTSFLVFSVSTSVYRGLVDVGVIGEGAGRGPEAHYSATVLKKQAELPTKRDLFPLAESNG